MREKKYKLTISLMVSNRKDTVPKTLESLKPILDNVSSELIVTDTGCDEELLEIIRKYTDNIIKFQWCNDFSKARNVSLSMAQGEWYMYVDDDEWFEDVTPIIDFFNSGESENFNAFDYIQRNYWDFQGTAWRDTPVGRAIRLSDTVMFKDAIHEHFSEYMEPIKMLNAYVHHYGYVYKTKEDHLKHAKRNLDLLEKQLEDGNCCLRQYVHMLQEHNGLEQHELAYERAVQAIDISKGNKEINRRYLSGIKCNVAHSLLWLGKNEETVQKMNEYLAEGDLSLPAYCVINGYLAHAYFNLSDVEGVLRSVREYFLLRDFFKDKSEKVVRDCILVMGSAFSGTMPNMIFYMGLVCALEKADEEMAVFIMKHKDIIGRVSCPGEGDWLKRLVEMMADSDEKAIFADTLIDYMDDLMCATKICNKLLDIKETDEAKFMELAETFANSESENTHVKLLKTIYCGIKGEVNKLKKN